MIFRYVCYPLFGTNGLNEGDELVANDTKAPWNAKKNELMGKCYNGFADLGLHGTTIRPLAEHCGYNKTMIYTYFKDFDDRIIQSTEYCMSKVEDEFMAKAPPMWRTYGGLSTRYPIGRQKSTAKNTA